MNSEFTLENLRIPGRDDQETPENTQETIIEDAPTEEVQAETPVIEIPVTETKEVATETPVAETPEIAPQTDIFPSDRFGGKYKSWEEVQSALEAPKEPVWKDDFIKKIVEKYEKDGSLKEYFEAAATDWNSLDDKEVMRRHFFHENSDLDSKVVEKLWNRKLREYAIDPELNAEEEIEENLAVLSRDANRARKDFIERQKGYLEPAKREEEKPVENTEAKIRGVVEQLPETARLRAEKKVVLKVDGEDFNYALDTPETVIESMVDENRFYSLFTQGGKLNAEKWSQVMAFAMDPQKFIKAVADHGRSLERSVWEKELKNPSIPEGQAPPVAASSGNWKVDLLNTFLEKGKTVRH